MSTDLINTQNATKSAGLGGTVFEFPASKKSKALSSGWPEPEPLTQQTIAAPYPMDALPGIIGGAIREVVEIVKCPAALAANSALSVLATAAQGVADIQAHKGLKPSPLSLYMLAIGESGERKTSSDNFFALVLNDWCVVKMEAIQTDLKAYKAELVSWNAQKRGLEKAIESTAAKGDAANLQKGDEARKKLIFLEQNEPAKVYTPDMVMEDTTPESIAYDLAHKWASIGILTSEAGTVFGGHGMKSDNIAKNLATLNKAWENGTMKISRRSTDSFTVKGARVSMGLSVQPAIIRQYHEQNGEAARGSGFFARFLLASPESTIGTRFITVEEAQEGAASAPQLNLFYAKLHSLLEQQYINGKSGKFENLPVLQLSDAAITHWVEYHNNLETEMQTGGDMAEARDIASKSADNAARLAGLFHLFNGGDVLDLITGDTMRAACRLASWHLYESRRFFGEIALPTEDLDAVKLDAWLIADCKATGNNTVGRNHALQRSNLRKADKLNKALDTLERAGRIRQIKEGKITAIEINPALLEGGK